MDMNHEADIKLRYTVRFRECRATCVRLVKVGLRLSQERVARWVIDDGN